MNVPVRQERCERARVWAALAPDDELAVLERRVLEAHLAHCAACRTFAGQVAAIAAELRTAAAERSARQFVLTVPPPRTPAYAHAGREASAAPGVPRRGGVVTFEPEPVLR